MRNLKPETGKLNPEAGNLKTPDFYDEYSEPCCWPSFMASMLMIAAALVGLILLVAALWLSYYMSIFLKTGAAPWPF